jgi:hypothetical protein
MLSLLYSALVVALLGYFLVLPGQRSLPPTTDNSDDGGEPLGDDLPDLDLPPGITRPISDFEPDYHRPRQTRPLRIG